MENYDVDRTYEVPEELVISVTCRTIKSLLADGEFAIIFIATAIQNIRCKAIPVGTDCVLLSASDLD